MTATPPRSARLPPRFVVRAAWTAHRALYAMRGRRALHPATPDKWGTLRLTTIGRRSGERRQAILGYLDDGPNLVTLAMNGWADPEPAWWLNLQAHPETTVDTADGSHLEVTGRAATGDERERLWAMWVGLGEGTENYAARRSGETAIVVLEPRRDT